MKHFLLAFCFMGLTQPLFAVCNNTANVYLNEDDDNGVALDLTYTCFANNKEICVYSDNKLATITNTGASSSSLTRRAVSSNANGLRISLKTSLSDSVFDYRFIDFELNKRTLEARLSFGGRGVDPFRGVIITPTTNLKLTCKQER